MRRIQRAIALFVFLIVAPGTGRAQPYPGRPVPQSPEHANGQSHYAWPSDMSGPTYDDYQNGHYHEGYDHNGRSGPPSGQCGEQGCQGQPCPAPACDCHARGGACSCCQPGVPAMLGGGLFEKNHKLLFPYIRIGTYQAQDGTRPVYADLLDAEVQVFRNTDLSHNNSALPRTRAWYDYNSFSGLNDVVGVGELEDGTVRVPDGTVLRVGQLPVGVFTDLDVLVAPPRQRDYDLDLHTFGLEYAFDQDRTSIELRLPFAKTLDSDVELIGGIPQNGTIITPTPELTLGSEGDGELQDVSVIFKAMLWRDPCRQLVVTGGLGLTAPTGDDIDVTVVDYYGLRATDFLETRGLRVREFSIENETFVLTPFLAMAGAPRPRMFVNGFWQIHKPLNDSEISYSELNIDDFEYTLHDETDFSHATLMQLDLGTGYWLYCNSCGPIVTGLASILEIHAAVVLEDGDADEIDAFNFLAVADSADNPGASDQPEPTAGNDSDGLGVASVTLGGHVQLGMNSNMRAALIIPLSSGDTFDQGFLFQWNVTR